VDELLLRKSLIESKSLVEKARQASEAKSNFLATMSHEIRTPMNGVLSMADIILADSPDEGIRDKVKVIKDSGEVLMHLLQDILDMSKIEAGKIEIQMDAFSLSDSLRSIESLWEAAAREKGIGFEFSVDSRLPRYVIGDDFRIRQVLSNPISNAIKFTSEGKVSVTISAGGQGSDSVRFEVKDSGIGIGAEALARLFTPFEQGEASTTRRFGGTGLGLSISKHLLDLMGGAIGCESDLGSGSRFFFELNLSEDKKQRRLEADCEDHLDSKLLDGLRLLVVDDVKTNRLIVSSLAKRWNCEVSLACDGAAAVQAVQRGDFDVVLMDLRMPVMDGAAACRKIRGLSGPKSKIPVVALTADAMDGVAENCRELGMDGYLTKPIAPERLYRALKQSVSSLR